MIETNRETQNTTGTLQGGGHFSEEGTSYTWHHQKSEDSRNKFSPMAFKGNVAWDTLPCSAGTFRSVEEKKVSYGDCVDLLTIGIGKIMWYPHLRSDIARGLANSESVETAESTEMGSTNEKLSFFYID